MGLNEYSIPRTKPLSQSSYINEYAARSSERTAAINKYNNFISQLESSMMIESLNYLVQKALPETITEADRNIARGLCIKYVEENNVSSLLRKFKTTSIPLAETALLIESTAKDIKEKTSPNDTSFTIKPTDRKNFFDTLSNISFDKIVDKIRTRVSKATEEFVQNNIKDKTQLEKMAAETKVKIDEIKTKNEEEKKEITKEFASMYNRNANNITSKRKRNVYEQMIRTMSESVMKNEQMRPAFVTESGNLDVEKVGGKVNIMYVFLETLNTSKIQRVNESYIKDIIKGIK